MASTKFSRASTAVVQRRRGPYSVMLEPNGCLRRLMLLDGSQYDRAGHRARRRPPHGSRRGFAKARCWSTALTRSGSDADFPTLASAIEQTERQVIRDALVRSEQSREKADRSPAVHCACQMRCGTGSSDRRKICRENAVSVPGDCRKTASSESAHLPRVPAWRSMMPRCIG